MSQSERSEKDVPGSKRVDIAIIGAGAAGLAAAADLTRAGRRVIVLEARDRIGGRIHTIREGSVPMPLELGAEFIHGRPEELLQIVRSARLLAYDVEGEHWQLEGRTLRNDQDVEGELEQIMSRLEELGPADLSFADFLKKCCDDPKLQRQREMAIAFVEGFDAAPADRISAQALARAEQSSGQEGALQSLRLIDGYDRVIQHLRDGIDAGHGSVRLRTVVSSIEWRPGRVAVHSHGPAGEPRETIHARGAIITIPVSVLSAAAGLEGAIRFEPDLLEKRRSAGRLEMGSVVKILIQFSSAFWEVQSLGTLPEGRRLDRMAFLHSARIPFATWWSFFPVRSNILVGWAGGPSAGPLIGRTQDDILRQAIQTLSKMLGLAEDEIESKVQKFWACDWQSDPFSRGAYSYVPVGAVDAAESLGKPVENTLFFAGEATDAQTFGGTVDSAIATGRRAARELLEAL